MDNYAHNLSLLSSYLATAILEMEQDNILLEDYLRFLKKPPDYTKVKNKYTKELEDVNNIIALLNDSKLTKDYLLQSYNKKINKILKASALSTIKKKNEMMNQKTI